jgi:hypothetical protein
VGLIAKRTLYNAALPMFAANFEGLKNGKIMVTGPAKEVIYGDTYLIAS